MKILLLGDASNYHRTLATGLRSLGHEVTVASDGTMWMRTERDIDIARPIWLPGKLAGAALYMRMLELTRRGGALTGYDVVSIHNPVFTRLKPHRVRDIFDRVKARNGSVFLTALGTDTPYVEMCTSPDCPLRYSEYRIGTQPAPFTLANPADEQAWLTEPLTSLCRYIYDNVLGAVTALYEYQLSALRWLGPDRVAYGGIPIDFSQASPVELPQKPEKVHLFLGRHKGRLALKGTDRLEEAALAAIRRHPGKGELIVVENRPFAEYMQLLRSAHVVIDQAYSYTPATNALLAMANGQCAVSGAEDEYYRFIGEHDCRPIYNSPITVEEMTELFSEILTTPPGELRERGDQSRIFARRHNDALTVARRFTDFWQSKM